MDYTSKLEMLLQKKSVSKRKKIITNEIATSIISWLELDLGLNSYEIYL